ncbi:unnamed protein product [Brassica oleracea var. botrytis]
MSRRNFTSITESGVKKTLDSMVTCANMFILSMSGYMCYTYLGLVILTQMVELPSQERWLQLETFLQIRRYMVFQVPTRFIHFFYICLKILIINLYFYF